MNKHNTVPEMKQYIKENGLKKKGMRLTMKKPEMIEAFKKLGHWIDSEVVVDMTVESEPEPLMIPKPTITKSTPEVEIIIDEDDTCLGTSQGDKVNSEGCSIAQICPCDSAWKNHGKYVVCVVHTAQGLVAEGFITDEELDVIASNAGQSACGHKFLRA